MTALKILKSGYQKLRQRYWYQPLSRSRTLKRMILHAEDATSINGAIALVYRGADHVIAVHPHDRTIGQSIKRTGGYQREEIDFAIGHLRSIGKLKGPVFLDVGANIGTQSIYAMRSGAFRAAVAFEPEPTNLNLLSFNLALNSLDGDVTIHAVACGSHETTMELWLNPENFGAHSLIAPKRDHGSVTVPVVPVDTVLSKMGLPVETVGMISLDVEGHEPAAIQGMSATLAHRPPLLIELNPDAPDFAQMIGHLTSLYNTVLQLSGPNLAKLDRFGDPVPAVQFSMPPQKIDVLFY